MKRLLELEECLKSSDDVKFLRLVKNNHPLGDGNNLLDLNYHVVLGNPIERELNYKGDIFDMKKVLADTLSVSVKKLRDIDVEYDTHYELSELRGVSYNFLISIGKETRSFDLDDGVGDYLKSIKHGAWRKKQITKDLFFSVLVNLYANEKFAGKCIRNDKRRTCWNK